jgi:hypothetical protein
MVKNEVLAVISHQRAGAPRHINASPQADVADNAVIGKRNTVAIYYDPFSRSGLPGNGNSRRGFDLILYLYYAAYPEQDGTADRLTASRKEPAPESFKLVT